MGVISNPILRGFNPDPSIIRVDDDFYIATSTFEWFPGVQIHHSRDLTNWRLITRPLDSVDKLDLQGVPDSCGVWAPCLTHSDGVYYLVYSSVKSFDGRWKDTPNFVVTAKDIAGPWSKPSYLCSSGFDGSLFHDDDGRKWFISMIIDHRSDDFFGGIYIQEYSENDRALVGERRLLTRGTELGFTEGPHIYKRNGFYYLLLAEGGTEYGHATTVMRSRELTGPYKLHPRNPILTSRTDSSLPLQKAGHASFVETKNDGWFVVFLVGRPGEELGRCMLGRETAIEHLDWVDNWPVLKYGGSAPRIEIPGPEIPEYRFPVTAARDNFDANVLQTQYQSLRIPIEDSWCSLTERRGWLRLTGRESLTSQHNQSLIARRLQSTNVEVSTCLEFKPENFQQMAGLVFYYNTGHYHYLHVTVANDGTSCVATVASSDNFELSIAGGGVDVTGAETVWLKGVLDGHALHFFASRDGEYFEQVGDVLDASILSDDYIREGSERYRPAFTGCFVGLCCQDLAFNRKKAYFDWFEYNETN